VALQRHANRSSNTCRAPQLICCAFTTLDDLDFIKGQLAQQPSRAWTSRVLLIGFGSMWALLAAVALTLAR
jgi:hypothetical protein